MLILAFETSCDDTAVAVVRNGTEVLSNIRRSQPDHNQYGGVVPEIAARLHADNWKSVLEEALSAAEIHIQDIDAIAVTKGPGLQTSLLTGTSAASFLSTLYQKPIIPVHHILGHLTSTSLDREPDQIIFPNLVLTVSGGHTSIYYRTSHTEVQAIGKTLDDACGEAFDKCAKMLGLGYPGGPIVSDRAKHGDPKKFALPVIMLEKTSLDFSFSGLKASIYRLVEAQKEIGAIDDTFINDVCTSFEATASKTLTKKILRAIQQFPATKQVHFVGGVSANTVIRQSLNYALVLQDIQLLVPKKMTYCTDNAAMIGAAAHYLYQNNPKIACHDIIEAQSRLSL
jgi:N6-L-threonylcarbamoyladenine synthase